MKYNGEFETTVLSGLPVLVKWEHVTDAEGQRIDFDLFNVKTGRPMGDWIWNRLDDDARIQIAFKVKNQPH
jgi:hypothetical protein